MAEGRGLRADARRNRERLLAVAAEAFAAHGEGASLDDIARRAGVGVGTLYRHFPTRRALLEAACRGRIEALADRADAIAARRPPGEALAAWLGELAVGTVRARGLKALLGTAAADGGPACGAGVREAAERLVRAAQDAGSLRRDVTAVEVLRLVHGVVGAAELSDGGGAGGPDETCVRRYLSLVLDGLRA